MPRSGFFRARGKPKYLAIAGATLTAALVAALVTQVSGPGAVASASSVRVPTVEETVAGLTSVAAGYPGGLPALLELFVTGECAGAQSYQGASPQCRSLIDLIVERGIGESLPAPTSATDPTTITSLPPTSTTTTQTPEPSTTTWPTMPPPSSTTPTTMTPPTTTPTTMPPPQPLPPLLVAVGDSVTSGHEARPVRQPNGAVVWRTTCDDPATSWAEDLRNLLGV